MATELEASGMHQELHFGSVFFHSDSENARAKYETYLHGIAEAVNAYTDTHADVFPVIVGMEKQDRRACDHLFARLNKPAPRFVSGEYDMFDIVAILRLANLLISSRFHAIVTSMPAGVPAIGVSYDERIGNLIGSGGRVLPTDAEDLCDRLWQAMCDLDRNRDQAVNQTRSMVAGELQKLGEMGMILASELDRYFPGLPRPKLPGTWSAHLPPLSPSLESLLEVYA